MAVVRVPLLQLPGHGGVESGEEEPRLESLAGPLDAKAADGSGNWCRELPAAMHRVLVALAGAGIGGHHLCHFETGVALEELEEALAHGASRAEHCHAALGGGASRDGSTVRSRCYGSIS